MSIKTKLIVGFLSTMIMIIAVNSLFTYFSVHSISTNTKELTTGLSTEVQRDVSGFSEHYAGTLTYHGTQNTKIQIENMIDRAKSDLLTVQTFQELYSNNPTQLENRFKEIKQNNKYISNIYITSNGNQFTVYPRKNGAAIKKQFHSNSLFQTSKKLKQKQFHVTNPYLDQTGKNYLVTISTPLFLNDTFFGVLALDLSVQKMTKAFAETKVGSSGYIIITNKDGDILSYKDQKLVSNHSNITSLPIYQDNKDGKVYLDINKVTYISEIEKSTGWVIYSVITQEEVKSFSTTISKNMKNQISKAEKSSSSIISKLNIIQVGIVLVLLIISTFISIFIARYFINPIRKLSGFMQKVANGDLTEKMAIKTKDEMSLLFQSVNHMVDSLRDMANKMMNLIHEVEKDSEILNSQAEISSNVTETVSTAMMELANGSEQLAKDMVNISENVENNVHSVQSMSNNIDKIVNHSKNTKSITSEGQLAMERLNKRMGLIVEQSVESSSIMKELDFKLQAINDITNLIYSIAEETNLLSLNASIEAARAGEHGRGFAVVAHEVKKLAEQSSQSVEKIADLISGIQNDSSKALMNIDHGRKSAFEGACMAEETEKSFNNIIHFIDHLANDIDEIAVASEMLSTSSQSISSSVESVVAISEQTSAGIQEVTSTNEEQTRAVQQVYMITRNLRELSVELRQSIDHFKL